MKDFSSLSTFSFRILGNGTMDCINGKAGLPFKTSTIYQVYKNINSLGKGLVINACMDTHPNAFMLGKKNFFTICDIHC